MPVPRVCNNINIPKIIKEIRSKRKLSQSKLAQKINVAFQTVGAYESGRIQPSLDKFLVILNIGGYSLNLIEDIYKTPKELLLPTSEEENINQNKEYQSSN